MCGLVSRKHVLVISLRALSWDQAEHHCVGVFPEEQAGHLHPAESDSLPVIATCDEQTVWKKAQRGHCLGTFGSARGTLTHWGASVFVKSIFSG